MISCPVCADARSTTICHVRRMPVTSCIFAATPTAARQVERADMELVSCEQCGHAFNRRFKPGKAAYGPGYENALGFSPRNRSEMESLADQLVLHHALHHKKVLEIGCGSADFLTMLCRKGANRGIGYDPTQTAREYFVEDGSVSVVPTKFTSDASHVFDFVCALHVLEHLHEPGQLLRAAGGTLGHEATVFFQVPNGLSLFRNLSIWDITCEHVSYFSPASIQRLLAVNGFRALQVSFSLCGQYINVAGRWGEGPPSAFEPPLVDAAYQSFGLALAEGLGQWKHFMCHRYSSRKSVVVWGAGSKAVTFLTLLQLQAGDGVDFIVDVDPRKHGRYMPVTAQRIVPPQELPSIAPDTVLVMNPEYLPEIRSTLDGLGLRCAIVSATPAVA